jgi:hypothetical protein
MGGRAPTVIAAMVQENLRGMGVLGGAAQRAIRRSLGASLVEAVEGALRIGWVETGIDRRIFAAIAEHAGLDGVGRVIERNLRLHFERPLFRPMVEVARRVHGLEVRPVLTLLSKSFNLVHRDNGALTLADRGGCLELELVDAEPGTVADGVYMHAFAVAFQTSMRLARPDGTVNVTAVEPARGFVRFTCAV